MGVHSNLRCSYHTFVEQSASKLKVLNEPRVDTCQTMPFSTLDHNHSLLSYGEFRRQSQVARSCVLGWSAPTTRENSQSLRAERKASHRRDCKKIRPVNRPILVVCCFENSMSNARGAPIITTIHSPTHAAETNDTSNDGVFRRATASPLGPLFVNLRDES